jgi:hypothetical protein
LLLLSVATYAALRSVRHIPLYTLIAIPILSATVQAWLSPRANAKADKDQQAPMTTAKASFNAILLAGFLIFLVGRLRYVANRQTEMEGKDFPADAVSFIAAHRPPAPMLNHYNWGGYFIWKLYPDYRVYVDGRADIYGDAFMNNLAAVYYLKGDAWKSTFAEWGIRTVVLPPDAPLATALRALPAWETIYSDKEAVVLTAKMR